MAVVRPSSVTAIARGLAGRCPACGVGHVFRPAPGRHRSAPPPAPWRAVAAPWRAVASARSCASCGWRFERCAGHWVGGNEINLLAAFTVGVIAWAASAAFLGLTPASAWIATAATGIFSVASYRRCRCVFFALDYLLDPEPDPASFALRDDDLDGGGDRDRLRDAPLPGGPSSPGGLSAPLPAPSPPSPACPAGSSESFIAPPPAPYPPPATVSP